MTHPRRLLVATVIAGALVAGATACTPDDPEPTPTPSATTPSATPTPTASPTPTLDAQQQRIEDAKAAYLAYTAAVNQVMQTAGATGWMETVVAPYVSGDLRPRLVSYYGQVSAQQLRQTGETKVASLEATESVEQRVVLEACLDNSGIDVVDPSGKSVLLEGFPDRLITVETMRQQDDGRWTLVASETDQARPC